MPSQAGRPPGRLGPGSFISLPANACIVSSSPRAENSLRPLAPGNTRKCPACRQPRRLICLTHPATPLYRPGCARQSSTWGRFYSGRASGQAHFSAGPEAFLAYGLAALESKFHGRAGPFFSAGWLSGWDVGSYLIGSSVKTLGSRSSNRSGQGSRCENQPVSSIIRWASCSR